MIFISFGSLKVLKSIEESIIIAHAKSVIAKDRIDMSENIKNASIMDMILFTFS
jgi:hypothetical protein